VGPLLVATRRRLRSALLGISALFGAWGVVTVAIAASSGPVLDVIGVLAVCWIIVVLMVGPPIALYLYQDLILGRKLLTNGTLSTARVTNGAVGLGGVLLSVTFPRDDRDQTLAFIVPISESEAQAFVGSDLPMLQMPDSPRQVGIVLPGQGLITTR
jgi:hypothetical protein